MLRMTIMLFFGLVVLPGILLFILFYSIFSQDISILSYSPYCLVLIAGISITLGIVTASYPLRYSPLKLIDKNNLRRFITNYEIMKHSFPSYSVILFSLLFFQIYNLTENALPIEFTIATSLYSIYFLIMMMVSIIFFVIVHPNKNYIFAVSKVYCMMANENKKEIYQLNYLIKSIEFYNVILKKYTNNITLDINKHIILKFVYVESKTIFMKKLLTEFDKVTDENDNVLEPMRYLLKEFGQDMKTLKQNSRQDQIITWSPILISIIIPIMSIGVGLLGLYMMSKSPMVNP